jgi:4-hydroxy-4-methyl-2-oxoglutarate aldolase
VDGDNLAVHVAVAEAPEGSVLAVTVAGSHERGWWGEVLTAAAQARGLRALVIDACVRDTMQIAERRFPVWARGTALRGTTKEARGEVGKAITLRGVVVEPGDWMVADDDGVAIVPDRQVPAVVAAAGARAEREAEMFRQLAAGRTTIELLGLDPHR